MEKIVCLRYPHMFKPVQSINAIVLLICLGIGASVDGAGVLWFIALLSLFVSVVATVLFLLDKNEPVINTITGGQISWSVVEFIYSIVLAVLCLMSTWLSFSASSHVKEGSNVGYIFAGLYNFCKDTKMPRPLYTSEKWRFSFSKHEKIYIPFVFLIFLYNIIIDSGKPKYHLVVLILPYPTVCRSWLDIFFLLQTIFYVAPALLLYDKMRDAETGRDLSSDIHYVDDNEVPYQGGQMA